MRDFHWTSAEKAIARKAFEHALNHELQAVIDEARKKMAAVSTPLDLWKLEAWLGKRRESINERYDYRYSVLPRVLGYLLSDRLLTEADLHGLAPDKLEMILRIAGDN